MCRNFVFIIGAAMLLLTACNQKKEIMAPVAKKISKELTIHGHTRIDNYYWLNQREDPEVIAYLEEENAYKDAVMIHTLDIQDQMYDEIKAKIKQSDESVPYLENGYYYFEKTLPETEYFLLCRKKGSLEAEEEVLLDVNSLASGFEYYQIGGASVSENNKILAYGVDTLSRRKYTIYFKNLETGEVLEDNIPLTTGGVTWANDNKTFYYTLKNETTLRSERIMKHTLGTPSTDDIEVFFEDDETFSVFIYKTKSKKFLIIGSESTLTSEYRFLDANKPEGDFKIIQPRTRELEYSVDHFGDDFYIRTNLDAQNFRLMKTLVNKTEVENWKEVIPHRNDVYFSNFEIFSKYLVIGERKEGINGFHVIAWNGSIDYFVEFDEEVYNVRISTNLEFDTDLFRFSYSSLTTPNSFFDYNLSTKERTLLKQEEVLGEFDKNNYETKRIYATASDGEKIPMSIVYRKGFEKNGENPALIYGYGSYGYTRDPNFNL
ncbi:MAG: S9 family peptidase, partial [Mariniphaga sp.]|nr:S9 family peptidase [Mariniphaga sp.]